MPRINPRLDPHELADLMAAPEHWDLLDQVPRHPAAWPDLCFASIFLKQFLH